MELYLQSPIRLHGMVLNQLITGTTLPFSLLDEGEGSASRTVGFTPSEGVPATGLDGDLDGSGRSAEEQISPILGSNPNSSVTRLVT
jgi:hypothetical protein